MLMGTYQNSIDGKNRISIPAKFRDELGGRCVLTRGLDDCLLLYPAVNWQQEVARYSGLPRTDEKARAFIRYTFGNAYDVDVDKQGRTVVPQILKDFAGFDKELVTIGMVDRVEIWSRENYENSPYGGKLSAADLAGIGDKYQV